MLKVNLADRYDRDVAMRLLDFFRSEAPWQRRLWTIGTVLSLREVLEASAAVQGGVLRESAFQALCHETEVLTGGDPGVGGKSQRHLPQACLKASPRPEGYEWLTVSQLLDEIDHHYLERWRDTLRDPQGRPGAERAARAVASHLLDAGFHEQFLHRWWTYRILHEPGNRGLADLLSDAHDLAHSRATEFEVLVPLVRAPGAAKGMPDNWLTATQVSEWIRGRNDHPREVRQVGGFLLRISARDEYSALDRAAELLERLSARVHLATRSRLQLLGRAWVRGHATAFPLRPVSRPVEIGALVRESKLYSESDAQTRSIDSALELLGPLREGPPGPAVAGGWAAVEALLVGPGDGAKRSIASDRLASLVACSFPRAELTTLAYAHASSNPGDSLAAEILRMATNRERATIVARAIASGTPLVLAQDSDSLAELRLKKLLASPQQALAAIEQHVATSLHRMYRQRNLVLHWGRMDAVCLRAALRTAAPLIGAGVDRIAHAWFKDGTSPLELCARAAVHRSWLEEPIRISPVDLLEPR
jgi:hypothetical protein